jgi:MFS family permease
VLEETTLATGPVKLRPGDRRMRRVRLGLFAAGLATFALLYTPQPVLPLLTASFRVTPAAASLAMSTGTGALAVAVIGTSSLSEVLGRRRVMTVSLLAAAVLGLAAPLAPSLGALVAIRVACSWCTWRAPAPRRRPAGWPETVAFVAVLLAIALASATSLGARRPA